MAMTSIQRDVCRLLAAQRTAQKGYVAGGVALNTLLDGKRISDDVDIFHDSETAVNVSWEEDRTLLEQAGYAVHLLRRFPSFIEARIERGEETLIMQWAYDSAFRFFPLIAHPDLGYTLHPFDAATNKVLALVGRIEPRDWLDVMTCSDRLQHLGLLCWAACGKDPGYSPLFLLEEASRSARFSASEYDKVLFEGHKPDPEELKVRWRAMLAQAREMVEILPPEAIGKCVLRARGELWNGSPQELQTALNQDELRYHEGHLCGAWPQIVERNT
jgi:hypothetical protein